MEEKDALKILKKFLAENKIFWTPFFAGLLSVLLVLAVGAGFLYRFRADVFAYLAKGYQRL